MGVVLGVESCFFDVYEACNSWCFEFETYLFLNVN